MEAETAGMPFYQRLLSLVIHGLVHVLGFDHEQGAKEARRMRYREKKLLHYATQHAAYKEIVSIASACSRACCLSSASRPSPFSSLPTLPLCRFSLP